MPDQKEFYYRHLPHIQPPEGIFFITYRLANSLPAEVIAELKAEHETELRKCRLELHSDNSRQRIRTIQSRHFGKFDKLLDNSTTGPLYLSDPAIAQIVADSLHFLDNREWTLICYCIMPNHVHLVIEKLLKELFRIMQSHKRHTAKQANLILDRTGSFWQAESYDHLVRDRNEVERIIMYVMNNPVKAGLVESWKNWPYSYCAK